MGGSQGNSNHKNPFEPPSCAHPAEAPDVRAALKSTGSHSRHTASKNTIYHNNTTPATLVPSPSKPHPLESEFVADQLRLRSVPANAAGVRTGGEFVLYWMQATQRLEDNWALRLATLEADRLGRPLLIYQGLDPTYEYASDRIHAFILEGARETAATARAAGLPYVFTLRRRRDDDRRVVDRITARACLVVTDLLP